MRYPNGITGRWEYDAADRITQISYQDPTGKVIAGWTYRFDPAGNPVEQLDHQGQTARFQYDAVGQLTEEAGARDTRRYRYLPEGIATAVEAGGAVHAVSA